MAAEPLGVADAQLAQHRGADAPPTLRPGQVLVLDNLKAHQGEQVRRAIEARGASLWFLPTYSPDLTPIAETFSKLKALLSRAAARTRPALTAAVRAALRAIGPSPRRTRAAGTPTAATLFPL